MITIDVKSLAPRHEIMIVTAKVGDGMTNASLHIGKEVMRLIEENHRWG